MRRAALLAVAVSFVTAVVRADPRSLTYRYSEYEEQAIRDAESELRTFVDPSPEGKTIERIDFVRLDPIDRHDPIPAALDVVHATSRTPVLRREVLVREGDPYKGALVDESARNLRNLPQLSLVLCVPMRGTAQDRVRLVVITKDVWSLYVDVDLAVTAGGVETLDLEPKETNVAGLHHTALGRFILEPATYSLGASYEIPRLDGRWLDLLLDGNAIINRTSGVVEGSYGTASITRPLYSSHTEWAWSTGVTWMDRIYRRYVDARETTYDSTPGATCVSGDPACIPWRWRERTINEQAKVTRSFGWETKNDVSLGASLSHATYRVPAAPAIDHGQACDALARGLSPSDPAVAYKFVCANVPQGEGRVGPVLQWHGYSSDFQRVLDFDSLGLQEDYRLGHDLWVRAYPVFRALGSTRDLFGTYAAAAYSVAIGDGLARAAVESTVEAEPDRISDAQTKAALGIVTPRFGIGRLVFTATALNRWRNYLNAQSSLGGDTMLRGYPSHALVGKDMVATNLEYRSRAFGIASFQLGAAAFYDVGDAFDGFDHLDPKHAVGLGIRAVFPQIERSVLRLDVGFPIAASNHPIPNQMPQPVSFFIAFHQALALPAVGTGFGP